MFFAQRIREALSTLRFRIVVWVTLVVIVMEVITNIAVSRIEERSLHKDYDLSLAENVENLHMIVIRFEPQEKDAMIVTLRKYLGSTSHHGIFIEIFDASRANFWSSLNTPPLPALQITEETYGPYDAKKHRVIEKKMQKPDGDYYYLRCGFMRLALQEDIDLLNRSILVASLSTILLVPLGAYFIATRATRPIAQIIAAASRMEPSHLDQRLPIRGSGDEIDQLSLTINGMLDRLASFINQNRDFVANAAHELRSPLTAIRSSVEVGLNRRRPPEEYTIILAEVMEEITRLAGLVNRLLILAEGDAGRLAGKEHTCRLEKIVRESVEMFDAVAEADGVHLSIGELSPAIVTGEDTNLRQVVRNLIDNAIKYNRNPGEVVVQLRVDSSKKKAILTVQDTGAGIDQEVLPRIFERFYRADKSRSREAARVGYGLGLSICKTIVQALHGEVTVESEVGKGSTFTVSLPIAEPVSGLAQSGEQRL